MISRFGICLVLGMATLASSAFATEFTGSDKGCFYSVFQNSCTEVSGTSSIGTPSRDLTFQSASFDRTGYGTVDLGTFSLGNRFSLAAGTFDLSVKFTAPAGTGTGDYSALVGALVAFQNGGALISFERPTTEAFTSSTGSFYLTMPTSPIFIGADSHADLMGTITPTPEPVSLMLAGSGLGLVGLLRLRRSRKA